MNITWVFSWWNLIFVIPFGLALCYLGVYTLSGLTFGDVDADLDADLDAAADLDTDLDSDLDADADGAGNPDTDAGHGSHPSTILLAMSWLGVGKVPLSIVLMVLMLVWGGVGFATNQLMSESLGHDWAVAIVSVPLAAIGSLRATSAVTRLIDRYVPLHETYARRRHELLGLVGQAVYAINPRFGMVSVRDDHGDLFQVPCRLREGEADVAKGAWVKLVAYSAEQKLFYVVPSERQVGA